MIFKNIKSFLIPVVQEKYKNEFEEDMKKVAIYRIKYISLALLLIEIVMLLLFAYIYKKDIFQPTHFRYITMYLIMLFTMSGYFFLFSNSKKMSKYTPKLVIGLSYIFTLFVLLWNAIISMLDQAVYGQITSYIIAIIGVGFVSLYRPINLLAMYGMIHIIFIFYLPQFQTSNSLLFGDYVNSTIMIIISWFIQCLLYKNKMEEYINKKIIEDKNNQLNYLYDKILKSNEILSKQAQRDWLTGLYNRSMFEQLLKIKWEQSIANEYLLTIIMIDIDSFKAFNDNYGHQTGDACIKKIAKELSNISNLNAGEVARYGGEEFIAVFNDIPNISSYNIAEQMRKQVEDLHISHDYSSASKYATISIGVYTAIPSSQSNMETFIENADNALYQAKRAGRNKVINFQ